MHPDLAGWLPHRLEPGGGRIDCRWRFIGSTRFTAPFFEETIQQCLSLPENSFGPANITGLNAISAYASEISALKPAAFIFHVSRCGSTLISQLLAEDPGIVSLSEVALFDQILRARFQPAFADKVDASVLLPAAIRIHGQRRSGSERALFVKFDSWHVGFYGELRALYPTTPFILLYRHPDAVLRSHKRKPGMHAVPGLIEPALFGWRAEGIVELSAANYLARVLEYYYDRFLQIAQTDAGSLLVSYEIGMLEVVESVARFTSTPLSADHRERMKLRAGFDAKNPDEFFAPTPDHAVGEAPAQCLASYEALERYRIATITDKS